MRLIQEKRRPGDGETLVSKHSDTRRPKIMGNSECLSMILSECTDEKRLTHAKPVRANSMTLIHN